MKSNYMLTCIGILYLAIGFCYVVYQKEIIYDSLNIDLEIMANVINGITISSFMFALSEAITECFLKKNQILNLKDILSNVSDLNSELDVHIQIQSNFNKFTDISKGNKYSHFINKLVPLLSNICWLLTMSAVSVGILSIFSKQQIKQYTSVGLAVVTFGLFILSFTSRELKEIEIKRIINNIWLEYYKNKACKIVVEENSNEQ